MKDKASLIAIGILVLGLLLLSIKFTNQVSDLNDSVLSLQNDLYYLEEDNQDLEQSLTLKSEELQEYFETLAWFQKVDVAVVEDDIAYDEFQDFELSFTLNERYIDSTLKLIVYKYDITGTNDLELYSEEVITSDTMEFSVNLTLSVLNDYEFYLEEVNGESIRYERISSFWLNRNYGIRFNVSASSVSGATDFDFQVTVKNNYDGINAFKVESAVIAVYYKGVLQGTYPLSSVDEETVETLSWQFISSKENAADYYYFILTFSDYTGDEHIYDFGDIPSN